MKELFDKCVKQAIELGRKYMLYPPENIEQPTQQEWDLALILFQLNYQEEINDKKTIH